MRLTAAFLGISLIATSALADSGLKRLTMRSDTLGWEAVGRVEIGREGFCTGVLVATDLVLTAGHCIVSRKTNAPVDPATIRFRAGLRDGKSVAEAGVARTVVHPDYDVRDGDHLRRIGSDIALLQLAQPIPAATAAPFMAAVPTERRKVSVVSYARNRSDALSWQRECAVKGRHGGIAAFSCDVWFGSSGAPVFDTSGPRARILSIISSGQRDDSGSISFGPEVSKPLAELKNALRAGRGVTQAGQKPLQKQRAGGARFLRP